MVKTKNNTPPEEQRLEEPAAVITPPPALSLISLQKLEVVYDTALHHDDGTQPDSNFAND